MRSTLGILAALAAASPAAAQTLLDEMAETGRFERFLAGIEAAGLDDRLIGPGPVTVFAPTDEAYDRFVDEELGRAFRDDPAMARQVLLTHIAEGAAFPADDLPRTIDVANGETVTVDWTGRELLATVDGGTEVSQTVAIENGDVRSGNGIAHPITGLLLPQDATLDALLDPDEADPDPDPDASAVAVAPVAAEIEEEPPIPSDGSYLDDVVEGADRDAIRRAPSEAPSEAPSAREDVTVLTTDPDAGGEEGVIVLTPSEDPASASGPPDAAPTDASPDMAIVDASPDASTAGDAPDASTAGDPPDASAADGRAAREAEEVAESVATLAPEARGGDVIIEEMNVTVESAPRVEPRTVAPSRMMGEPAASETAPPAGEPAPAAPSGGDAPGAEPAASADGPEEAILSTTMIGWPVYGQDGEEVGEVGDVIVLQDTGAVDGVLVKVGGFLGTHLGSHLVRVDLDELRIDAADEALIADVPGDDIAGRQAYTGPELRP